MNVNQKTSQPRKIIVTVTNDLVTDNRVNKVCQTLVNMGFEVTLIGRLFKDSPEMNYRNYSSHRFHLWFNRSAMFYANYNIRLFFYLLFSPFDIVLSNDLDSLPAGFFASRLKRKKIVYDSHEYFTEVPELIDRPRTKRTWERIESYIVPKLDKAYTVCQSIAEIYTQKYGVPFHVVRNLPVQVNETEAKTQVEVGVKKPFLIYQGFINKGRGIEEIIDAMKLLPQVSLIIAGAGDLIDTCKAQVETLKLTDRVLFTGRVPLNELHHITKQALAGLSVEKDLGLNYRYALPNKLFDYMNAGIPVITSALPEMKRVVNTYRTGIVIAETTPHAIAAAVQELLDSPELVALFKQNSHKASHELCWENEERIVQNIFKDY